MSNFRRKFLKSVPINRPGLRRFLTRLENQPPRLLDEYSIVVDKEVWQEVDCLACSNCCRAMTPTYNGKDLKRIAGHLGMTIQQFKDKWLYKNREGEWMNKSTPCQFLDRKTNMCSIYEVRPVDCAEFPHLTKKKVKEYIHIHHQNVNHCPATFKWVEKLMAVLNDKQPILIPQDEPYK